MKPIVHGLEARYGDRIGFIYLNTDSSATTELKQALEFEYMPYFVLLDGEGNIIRQWAGSVTEDEFVEEFDFALSSP